MLANVRETASLRETFPTCLHRLWIPLPDRQRPEEGRYHSTGQSNTGKLRHTILFDRTTHIVPRSRSQPPDSRTMAFNGLGYHGLPVATIHWWRLPIDTARAQSNAIQPSPTALWRVYQVFFGNLHGNASGTHARP